MTIRIVLADDHAIVLKGLHFFLSTQANLEIIGEAKNPRTKRRPCPLLAESTIGWSHCE